MANHPVLIVDDNRVNQVALQALVSRLGFATELVSSGPEALHAMTNQTFAVVLLDLMMPGMNGYETAEQLRKLEFGTGMHTPVIAVTALDRSSVVDAACSAAGMNDVITKPVDAGVLSSTLERWGTSSTSETPASKRSDDGQNLSIAALRTLYGEANLPKILQVFMEVTTTLLAQLETALEKHEDATAKHVIHELKGGMSEMRANEMTELCREMERTRQAGDWTKMAALYATLSNAFLRVEQVLSGEGVAAAC